MRQLLTLVICLLFSPIWAQSEFRTVELSFNSAGYVDNFISIGENQYYDFSERVSSGVRLRKRVNESFAFRLGFVFDQFKRTMEPNLIWEEAFVRKNRLSWGVDHRWRFKFIEPFVFADLIIQKQLIEGTSGGGCIIYYDYSEVSKMNYGIAPGFGINFRLGKRFHIGLETAMEFLTGTSEKTYWPYGLDENRTIERQHQSDISFDPVSGIYFGINF